MVSVTAIAHPNIALVKYWGKRDVALNLPAVPSLSLTLDGFQSRTTVTWGASEDRFVLNGAVRDDPKVWRFLDRGFPGRPPCAITSDNDFPTGAGLASSASGFAALALAASRASGGNLTASALSALARQGSGSACRSIFGGFVEWALGERDDGTDSHAVPVAGADHWDVRMVAAIVSEQAKAVSSTEGMERSRQTSELWPTWVSHGQGDVDEARAAVLDRDLPRLGEVMERSTFRMHATMHTARPPLLYWQPATVALLHEVFALRAAGVGAWATMDAGPQVKVLCAAADAARVSNALARHSMHTYVHGPGGPARIVA